MTFVLNGFEVDPALAQLMFRPDWHGRRTDPAWMARFPGHPADEAQGNRIPFVQLNSPESAARENEGLRDPELQVLCGKPDAQHPPGDFDPAAGYLIGFTDYVDSAICVDLRPARPRVIYDRLGRGFATAFTTLEEFVEFFLSQHGRR